MNRLNEDEIDRVTIEAGARANVPPLWLKALSLHETVGAPRALELLATGQPLYWNASAIGGAGEIGLGQIKPSTARDMGFTGTDAELFDPVTNLTFAGKYLRTQLEKFGTLPAALSAYNAGHPISSNVSSYVTPILDLLKILRTPAGAIAGGAAVVVGLIAAWILVHKRPR